MSDLPVFVVTVTEVGERSLDLQVHADNADEALEEAMSAYVDTNAAIGNWGEFEKTGIRVELVHG